MRSRFALALVALAGCGPRPASKTAATVKPGTVLRLAAKAGDETHGRVTLAMDVDMGAGQEGQIEKSSGGQHLALAFKLGTVEKVEAVDADGTAHVHARLVDVMGAASQGGDQNKVDLFAAALDKVTIGFARSARGDVSALELTELTPPLTDQMVRPMLNAVFAAQRGTILPDGPATPGMTWNALLAFPPNGGFDGGTTFQYQYVRDDQGQAVIDCDVVIDGQGGGKTSPRRIAGRSTDEYQLDRGGVRFRATRIDTVLELEQTLPSSTMTHVRQHVRAEWARQQENP
jgi:hypothetical protein